MRLRTQLPFREEIPDSGQESGIVLTYHGYGANAKQTLPLAEPFRGQFRIIALESPRPSLVYGRSSTGRSWYNHQGLTRMETGTFGDGLAQVEQYLIDTVEKYTGDDGKRPPIYLLGVEQGGAMALSLAAIWPDVLSGVVTVCGHLPDPPGWSLDTRPMENLPVFMIHDPEHPDLPEEVITATTERLKSLGASLEERVVVGARTLPDSLVDMIQSWKDNVVG